MSDNATTLSTALLQTVASARDAGITFVDRLGEREFISYAELHARALAELGRLQGAGLTAGSTVVLQMSSTRRHLELLWACVLGRFLSVNVSRAPSYTERNGVTDKLHNVWRMLGAPPIVTDAERESDVRAAFALYGENDVRLLAVDRLPQLGRGTVLDAQPDDVVFLQLTSGSTGTPKAIQMTHRGIVSHIEAARQTNNFSAEDVSLNWLSMDHVAPIVAYHFKDTLIGSAQLHVDMEWILGDPLRWLDLMDEFRVTHSWSPNFGYKLLHDAYARRPDRAKLSWDLRCLRQLMNAGEQVTMAVIRPVLETFGRFGLRDEIMQPVYGMAETCTCITYNNTFSVVDSELRGSVKGIGSALTPHGSAVASFVDCGAPAPGVELRIVDSDNRALGDEVCGRLQVRGAIITPGYLHNPAANAESFVGDGWFNTGDLGLLRQGRLFLVGREKETIIIRGANFFCYELEAQVCEQPGVLDTFVAATSIRDEASGTESLVLFFVPSDDYVAGVTEADLAQSVATAFGLTPKVVLAVSRRDFAKTTSGKLQRSQMRAAYLAGELRPRLAPKSIAERVWTPAPASPHSPTELKSRAALVFGGAETPAAGLRFGTVTLVEPGAEFARTERGYTIDPTAEADYARLFSAVRESSTGDQPLSLIFSWDLGSESAWLPAVVPLARALVRSGIALEQLVVTGDDLVRCTGDARVNVHAEVAASYLQSACRELLGARFRLVDHTGQSAQQRSRTLVNELCDPTRVSEVAYRAAGRLIATHVESGQDTHLLFEPNPLALDGRIVVSGGMGGLGRRLVRDILRDAPGARVSILGRRSCELRAEDWPELSAHDLGRLEYRQLDFSDRDAVMRAFAEQELAAVFHLAGTFRHCSAGDETEPEVAAVQHAKVAVEQTLEAIAARDPNCLIVAASSYFAHDVQPRMAAYCSANRGLEAVIAKLAARGVRAVSVVFGAFDGIGMNDQAEALEYQRAQGLTLLQPEHAYQACQLACTYPGRTLLFGVPATLADASAPSTRSETAALSDPRLQSLLGAFSQATGRALDEVSTHKTYFELGADSLQLTRFRQALQSSFGIDVPMNVLYRFNTLDQLYDNVIAAGDATKHPTRSREVVKPSLQSDVPLLKLVSGSDPNAVPIVLVPPAGGVIAPYQQFIAALPRDRDIWGFEDPAVHAADGPDWDLGPLLERMAQMLIANFTRAPIILSYSGGGFMAWALTQVLNERGLPPPLVVLIDTYLIEHPHKLADAMHPLSLAFDGGFGGAAVRATFHTLRALGVPLASSIREAASRSLARRNTTFQSLFETHRYYHGWKDSLSEEAMSRPDFERALDDACAIVRRDDPEFDMERMRQIYKHACLVTPKRMLSFVPKRLPNAIALFEVEKKGLTIKELISKYATRIVAHELIPVPSYDTLGDDFFRFARSPAAAKHFLCMYDRQFVDRLATQLQPLMNAARA